MFRSAIWLILSQIIVLSSIPYLARAYSVEEFSYFAIFSAFFVLSSKVCNLRLPDAIVVEKKENLSKLIISIYFVVILFSLFFSLLYAMFDGIFSFNNYIIIFLATVCITQVQIRNFLDIREKKYGRASMWFALVNILTVAFQILLSTTKTGLIYGQLLAILMVSILTFPLCYKYCKKFTYLDLIAIVKLNRKFAIYLTLYSLVAGLKSKFIYFILANGSYNGVLSQAERISNAPNTLISSVIRPVIYSTFNSETIKKEGEKVLGGLMFLIIISSVPLLYALNYYIEDVVLLVLGEQWLEYHEIFFMAAVSAVIMLLTNWMDKIFDLLHRQQVFLIIELCFLPIYIISIYIAYQVYGDQIAVMTYLVLNSILSITWLFVIYYLCGFGIKMLSYRMFLIVLYAVVFVIVVGALPVIFEEVYLITMFAVLYLLSLVVTYRKLALRYWVKKYI